ncbi:MAG: hypothetical protein Q4E47_00140 [Candidatus Saccharibacteria bacterium]|nr:hypothetical protein [Candidatus Saccharibacteria bacterium]
MDDPANGYDGDSGLDDQWSSEGAGKPDIGPAGPAGEDTKGMKDARRVAAAGLAKKGEAAAAGKPGEKKGGLDAAKAAEGAGGPAGFANNVTGKDGKGKSKLEQKADKAVPGSAMLKKQLKKFGPFGAILGMIITLVCLFSMSQTAAPFGLVANGLDQFNSVKTILAQSTKHYGPMFGFSTKTDNTNRHMTGHVAGWFDKLSSNLHKFRIHFNRNKYKNLDETDTDADVVSAAKGGDSMEEGLGKNHGEADDNDLTPATELEGEDVVDNGDGTTSTKKNGIWEKVDGDNSGYDGRTESDRIGHLDIDPEADIDADTTNKIADNFRTRANAVLSTVNEDIGVLCGVVKVVQAINAVITAMHVASVLNYVVSFLNAIQQAQAGDGGVALHYFFNQLSQKGNTYGIDHEEGPIKEGTNALESDAWNQFFSDGSVIVGADDPIAQKFNKDYAGQNSVISAVISATKSEVDSTHQDQPQAKAKSFWSWVAGLFNMSKDDRVSYTAKQFVEKFTDGESINKMYHTCVTSQALLQSSLAAVDAVTSVIAIFTGGISEFAKKAVEEAGEKILDVTRGIVVSALISAMIPIIVPKVARWLAMDLIENMLGEDAAYAINSGFNMYLGKQMQQSSGLPGNLDQVLAQYQETQIAIAEEAEYQRSIRSPFDATSKYTFLGSIVNSVTPIATAMSGPLTTISKTVSLVGSSIGKLLPTASATTLDEFETSLNYNCPGLEEYDLVGDAFCNPYYVSEYKTLKNDDPFQSMDELDDSNFVEGETTPTNLSGRENKVIKDGSELGNWAISCTRRDAQFGLVDPQTMTDLTNITTGNDSVDAILDGALSLVPVVGSALDAAQAVEAEVILPWADGSKCLDEQALKFSRYSEDQRWLEAAGDIDESAVAVYLDSYYERFPPDTSTEGTIARYAGMTKSAVEDTLAIIEYGNWLATYSPDETYGPTQFETTPHEDYQYEGDSIIADAPDDVIADVKFVFVNARNEVEIG